MSDSSSADRPRVLLTNDDGWDADGLKAVGEVIADFAEVLVVAPRHQQSAVGHAITLHDHVDIEEAEMPFARETWLVDGTPADCVKIGIRALYAEDPPTLVVSGMNNGPNVGVNVLYSGTVGAALESTINGVQALAVSKEFGEDLTYCDAARLMRPIVERLLARPLPEWHILNINFPNVCSDSIAGTKLTRHGVSGFDERYAEQPSPGKSSRRFKLEGEMKIRDNGGLTDAEALRDKYVSITPLGLDLSAAGLADESASDWQWVIT